VVNKDVHKAEYGPTLY